MVNPPPMGIFELIAEKKHIFSDSALNIGAVNSIINLSNLTGSIPTWEGDDNSYIDTDNPILVAEDLFRGDTTTASINVNKISDSSKKPDQVISAVIQDEPPKKVMFSYLHIVPYNLVYSDLLGQNL